MAPPKALAAALVASGALLAALASKFLSTCVTQGVRSAYEGLELGLLRPAIGSYPAEPYHVLGDALYRPELLQAPAASGTLLAVLAKALTELGWLSSFLLRNLLTGNKAHVLRELASQTGMAPLQYPMYRMGEQERAAYDQVHRVGPKWSASEQLAHLERLVHEFRSTSAVADYYFGYKEKRTTVTARIVEQLVPKIKHLNKDYRAFSLVNLPDVVRQCAESDRRWASGEILSALDGVPVAVKEMVAVRNYPPSARGSWLDAHRAGDATEARNVSVSRYDDPVIASLRSLGVIIIGVTSMTEGGVTPLGYGVKDEGPFNPHGAGWAVRERISEATSSTRVKYGEGLYNFGSRQAFVAGAPQGGEKHTYYRRHNFYRRHYSGGSSGGSAVAVALGLCPFAVGFDGGGSIRIPAAWSGVVGLATTFGRIKSEHVMNSMVKGGPLAASAVDSVLGAYAMAVATRNTGGAAEPRTTAAPATAEAIEERQKEAAYDRSSPTSGYNWYDTLYARAEGRPQPSAYLGEGFAEFLRLERPPSGAGAARRTIDELFEAGDPAHKFEACGEPSRSGACPEWWLGLVSRQKDKTKLRIGIFRDAFVDDASEDVLQAVLSALLRLKAHIPVEFVPISLPNARWLQLAHSLRIASKFATEWDVDYWGSKKPAAAPEGGGQSADDFVVDLTRGRKRPRNQLEANTRITVGIGSQVSAVEALACDRLRHYAFRYVSDELFSGSEGSVSFVVSPTLARTAPLLFGEGADTGEAPLQLPGGVADVFGNSVLSHGASDVPLVVRSMRHIFLGNLVGLPGISVPVGFDSENDFMPIGMQVYGKWWDEVGVAKLAMIVEAVLRS